MVFTVGLGGSGGIGYGAPMDSSLLSAATSPATARGWAARSTSTRRRTSVVAAALALAVVGTIGPASAYARPLRGQSTTPAASAAARAVPHVTLSSVASGLNMPTDVASPAGSTDLFVAQKCGGIRLIRNGVVSKAGSIKALTSCDSEHGLLSMAFHPKFADNGLLYLFYTRRVSGDLQLSEVSVRDSRVLVSTIKPLLRIRHRESSNHNGGDLAFDGRGLLHLSTGDGGGSGNEFGHAQDPHSMLGKLLRIDVDHGRKYAIPAGNPLKAGQGRREIYAVGLRNPWRMAWDAKTRSLWIGDVGQSKVEEIDRVRTGDRRLRNLGWSRYEGRLTYDAGERLTKGRLVWPRATYRHSKGISVIGGAIYRGSQSPSLSGYYVYGDLSGWIAGFAVADKSQKFQLDTGKEGLLTVSMAGDKELYAGFMDGTLYRVTAS